jgi:WD40 repeat protein
MKTIKPLPADKVKLALSRLEGELGPADLKKLDQAISLIDSTNRIRLDALLSALFPESSHDAALSNLRGLRSRLNTIGETVQVNLVLIQDGQNRSLPQERWCWFEGDDVLALVAQAQANSTYAPDEATFVAQGSAVIGQDGKPKRHLRYFVSYAHIDDAECKKLQDILATFFGSAANYTFERWHDKDILLGGEWRAEIQQALDECDFGLLLLSPAFFSSNYIKEKELPTFIRDHKPAIPVALKRVAFDGSMDTRGLEHRQVYSDKNQRSFLDCRDKKSQQDFVENLWAKIRIAVQAHLEVTTSLVPKTYSDKTAHSPEAKIKAAREHAMQRQLSENELFNPQDGQTADLANIAKLTSPTQGGMQNQPLAEPAIKFLEAWAIDPEQTPYLALLGELGMGKTTHCKQLTRVLCSGNHGDKKVPLPIYLDLRLIAATAKLASQDSQSWQQLLSGHTAIDFMLSESSLQSNIASLTAQDLKSLLADNQVLVIFDGLDEVLVQLSSPSLCSDFVSMLYRLLPIVGQGRDAKPAGKMIVACRSHYFPSVAEQNATLLQYGKDKMRANLFTGVMLLPFSQKQIKSYLRLTLPDATDERVEQVFDLLASVHNLLDVGSRPMNLSLLNDFLPAIESWKMHGETISSTRIYAHVVEQWLVRDTDKHHVSAVIKPTLMMHLALALWKNGARGWSNAQLEAWLVDFRNDNNEYRAAAADKAIELLKEDLRNSTFIVRLADDQFRFAHTSMQEYFLASALFEELKGNSIQGAWSSDLMNAETFDFLGELILESKDRESLTNALRNRIDHSTPSERKQVLAYCLQAQRRGLPAPVLTHWQCEDLDLSNWVFEGTRERPLNLRHTHWINSNLQSSRFIHCDLTASVLKGDFRLSKFDDCFLNDAQPNFEVFAGADFLRCDIRNVDLAGAAAACVEFMACHALKEEPKVSNDFLAVIRRLHSGSVSSIVFSPDGKTLASASADKTIKLWDVGSYRLITSLEQHTEWVSSVAFSPDGKTLASASADKTIKLWDVGSYRLITSLEQHTGGVSSVAFSPDGKTLASASADKTINLWDVGSYRLIISLEQHTEEVGSVAFSPDGKTLASASFDNTIKLWDVGSYRLITSLEQHKEGVTSVAFSPDGKTLASASYDETIKLWDVGSFRLITSLEHHKEGVSCVAFSPDGKILASASYDETTKLWDVGSYRLIASLERHTEEVSCVVFSPDGKTLASASGDKTIKLWDVGSYRLITSLERHTELILSVAFSPDGKTLASASNDKTIKLWDVDSYRLITSLERHTELVWSVAFSPDGKTLASASLDKTIKLWDVGSYRLITSLEQRTELVWSVAFSPDGKTLASASNDKTIKLWDVDSYRLITSLEQHTGGINSVAFSPDGNTLASASDDNSIKLWDAGSYRLITSLEQHTESVYRLAFSPDGKTLASASFDNTLKLWGVGSYRLITSLEQHTQGVRSVSVAFLPDGRVASLGDDGVKFWVRSEDQIVNICSIYTFSNNDFCTIDHINNKFIEIRGEAERYARWFKAGPPAQWLPVR